MVDLYGRKVKLASCDDFTREYLTSEGIELNPFEPPPVDNIPQVKIFVLNLYNSWQSCILFLEHKKNAPPPIYFDFFLFVAPAGGFNPTGH